jgi:inositol transporter-like SP family MFS transporter
MTEAAQAPSPVSGEWKATILAGLANYIDAGSIIAGSAALALWVELYNLTPTFVGLLGAFSANAISAGIGALIGGRLCDRYGRKKIYQYDMLFYAFGMLWLVFAVAPWMIVVGFVLVGLAVGADIPASWSLIAELAPKDSRGKHSGVAQILWYAGPIVVLLMFLLLAPLGILGARIVFAHLALLAVGLTFFRSKMKESQTWVDAKAKLADPAPPRGMTGERQEGWKALLAPRHLKSMAFLIGMYGIWNLWAGTVGFFFPYILRTVGGQSQAVSIAAQAYNYSLSMISILFLFMPLSDRVSQRLLFAVSAIAQVIGMIMLATLALTVTNVLILGTLISLGAGCGAQSFFQLWSAELFPTLIRSSAQGLMFAVVRIALGFWSFFVPVLTQTGFHTLAWILVAFLAVSGVIGTIWAPNNAGKSLEEIQDDATAVSA